MLVSKLGVLPPTTGRSTIEDQLRLSSRYYNDLVAIENGRRAAIRAAIADSSDAIGELDAEIAAADLWVKTVVEMIKDARINKRSREVSDRHARALATAKQQRSVITVVRAVWARRQRIALSGERVEEHLNPTDASVLIGDGAVGVLWARCERCKNDNVLPPPMTPEAIAAVAAYKPPEKQSVHERRTAGKAYKKLVAAANVNGRVPSVIEEINEIAAALARNARKWASRENVPPQFRHGGLYSGTYLSVERAVEAAKNPPDVPGRNQRHWLDPIDFHRYDGEGSVGSQVQWRNKTKDGAPPKTADLFVDAGQMRTIAQIEDVRPKATVVRLGLVEYLSAQVDLLTATGMSAESISKIQKLGSLPGWALLPVERRRTLAKTINAERALPKENAPPRQDALATLRVRVASDDRGKPIWATFPMLLDRPLPDGIVKWVKVTRRFIGPREQWSCEITVDEAPTAPRCGVGKVVLHCGWYREPPSALEHAGRLRVATWMDEHGHSEHVHLAADGRGIESGMDKADSLESIRSRYLDSVIALLTDWLDVHADLVPEWMRARTIRRDGPASRPLPTVAQALAYMRQWRAPGKLAALVRYWREHRFDGDDDAFLGTESWRYRDHHLWEWQRSQETNSQRRRKNDYRVLGAQLGRAYGTLVIDNVDYSALARPEAPAGIKTSGTSRRQADAGKTGPETGYAREEDWTQRHRRIVAPSILREVATNAMRRRGGTVEKIDAKNESIECPKCGEVHPAQQHVREHLFACTKCTLNGVDVDTVACLNALRRAGCEEQVRKIIKRMERVTIAAE